MTAPKLIKVIVLTTLVIGVALILSAVCSEIQGASNTAPPRFGKLGSAIVSREVHRLSLPFDHRAVALILPGAVTVIGSTPSTMTRSSPSGDPDTILRATR